MKLSVVTATYNSAQHLPRLIESLRGQTDPDFEWVVADGGSRDATLELLAATAPLKPKVSSCPDFGIYDALNRAIRLSSGDYYVVIGSDDYFFANAIAAFKRAMAERRADIVTGRLQFGDRVYGVRGGSSLLNKHLTYVSGHAVSTAFRKALHERFGYYSSAYPIAADRLFILECVKAGATIAAIDEVIGCFSTDGTSHRDVLGTLTESYRIQLKFENKLAATLVFLAGLARNFHRL